MRWCEGDRREPQRGRRAEAEGHQHRRQPWDNRVGAAGLTVSLAPLKQASDADVYKCADDGTLNRLAVIERAQKNQLVDGSDATCGELRRIVGVDRATLKLDKDKL
eukprot:246489-Prymnesium_polylepis.1